MESGQRQSLFDRVQPEGLKFNKPKMYGYIIYLESTGCRVGRENDNSQKQTEMCVYESNNCVHELDVIVVSTTIFSSAS